MAARGARHGVVNGNAEEVQVEDLQRLVTFQARQIAELERQLAQQVNESLFLLH